MALSAQEQDFISRIGILRNELVALSDEIELRIAEFNFNDYGNNAVMSDVDITAAFPSLTQGKLFSYINTLQAIRASLGAANGAVTEFGDKEWNGSNFAALILFEV